MKKLVALVSLVLIGLLAVACQPQVVEVEVTRVVEETVVEEVAVEVTRVVEETVVETVTETIVETSRGAGERVTLLYWQAPSTLNNYLSGGTKEQEAASIILEPLARYDETGSLVPFLASDIPTVSNGGVSEDLTTITWTLKEGILWSDGSPLTADDVVFTYEYCSDPDTGCAHAAQYEAIDTVTAVDDLTVEIVFQDAKPFPYDPFVGTTGHILQKAQFGECVGAAAQECTDANFAPIGTGPYVIQEFLPNDTAVYVMNENYRDANKPFFKEVFLKGGGDAAAAARAVLETGEGDYAWNMQVEPEILNQMQLAGKGKLVNSFGTCVERLMVNFTNPSADLGDDRSEYMDGNNPHPFLSDIVVRQALSMAIDRGTLNAVGYGDAGQPTCNVLPAPSAYVSTANDACLTQDIEAANALLDEAGIIDTDNDGVREKDGVPLSILYQTSTNSVRQGTQAFIKQYWEQIGVETELRNIDASVFFGGDPASPDTYGKFFADIEMYTNCGVGTDPQGYMAGWTTDNISGEANTWQGSNIPRYYNEEYDALVAELSETGELEERARIAKELNDILMQDYVMIPLIHRGSLSAHSNTLLGVRMNAWDSELWNIADWTRSSN